jgi:hypothetical protein
VTPRTTRLTLPAYIAVNVSLVRRGRPVVAKDVEPDTVVVGNPARVVRRLEPTRT